MSRHGAFRPIGLDLATNAIGICRSDGTTATIRPKAGADDPARRLDEAEQLLRPHLYGATFALIEGYAPGGQYETLAILAESTGVVKRLLFEQAIGFDCTLKPTQLKKYATGNGRAEKWEMVVAANAHGAGIAEGRHDEADAWWLRRICLDHANGLVPSADVRWDRYRLNVLENVVVWP